MAAKRKMKKRPKKKSSGGGSKSGQNAIKWISNRAKQIRQRNRNIEWKNAIKQASAMYRSQK